MTSAIHGGTLDTLPEPLLVPGGEPFLLQGGSTGCVLVHGFTAMPEEMRPLGDVLAAAGHTVHGIRLPGHGTEPRDLLRVRWRDWVEAVADSVALLHGLTEKVVLVGQSLGGVVVLSSAARLAVAGVVALSTPSNVGPPPRSRPRWPWRVQPKGVPAHAELGLRREADYPAYAAVPARVEREVGLLIAEMHRGLSSIRAPTLVVSSELDPWCPATPHGRAIAAGIPGARLLVLEDVGHSITLDPNRAEAFAAIRDFVSSI